jgi:transposase InsO family protein
LTQQCQRSRADARIDELFTTWPFLGSRRMTTLLRAQGHAVIRKRNRRLMREMGIVALGPKPSLSKPSPGHKIYKAGIASWITFYNGRRPHQALGNRTPIAVWRQGMDWPVRKSVAHMPTASATTANLGHGRLMVLTMGSTSAHHE